MNVACKKLSMPLDISNSMVLGDDGIWYFGHKLNDREVRLLCSELLNYGLLMNPDKVGNGTVHFLSRSWTSSEPYGVTTNPTKPVELAIFPEKGRKYTTPYADYNVLTCMQMCLGDFLPNYAGTGQGYLYGLDDLSSEFFDFEVVTQGKGAPPNSAMSRTSGVGHRLVTYLRGFMV